MKRPDELSDDAFLLAIADWLYFFESCLKIVPKEGGLAPLVLNDEQVTLLRLVYADWKAGKPVRFIILKARQMGISTLIEAILYLLSSTMEFFDSLVISHERDSARHLLEISQRYATYDARHARELMPDMSHQNKNELTFDNPNWRGRTKKPGLGSRMRIATADNKNAGHSLTVRGFHASEVARWKHPQILTGVLESMPLSANTIAILESTANGASGLFYDMWTEAERKSNEFTSVFLSWKGRKEYRVRIPDGYAIELTADEEALRKEHGLDDGQLLWRRQKIMSPSCQGQGRPAMDVFREQYPLTPEEAFVSTGRTYFDLRVLVALQNHEAGKTSKTGIVELVDGPLKRPASGRTPPATKFIESNAGYVKIWKPPTPGADYVIGADVSAGIRGCDWSVAYVMNRMTKEYVARYRGIVDPRKFSDDLIALAWFYNEAFLAPEANSIGVIVARSVAERYARSCYYMTLGTSDRDIDTERPGWYTTSANRKHMFASMRQAVNEGGVKIWCEEFIAEAKTFIVPEGPGGELKENAPRAERHKHDDCVMGATITYWIDDPQISGIIRRAKASQIVQPTWRHAAMAADRESEGVDGEEFLDEHLGRM